MTQTHPDWYPDPSDPALMRYWDGIAWSAFTRPAAPASVPSALQPSFEAQPKRNRRGFTVGWIVATVVGIGLGSATYDCASTGTTGNVSDSGALAFEIPADWVNAADHVGIDGDKGVNFEEEILALEGSSVVGTWLTSKPGGRQTPQMVWLIELTPGDTESESLPLLHASWLHWYREPLPDSPSGGTIAFTSATGLDGQRTIISFTVDDEAEAKTALVSLGHGRHFALVAWTSHDGPVDEAEMTVFLDSLRLA